MNSTHNLIQRELDANEQLLWAGQPKQGLVFRNTELFAIPFSILWGGGALFGVSAELFKAIQDSADDSITLESMPPLGTLIFLVLSVYLLIGRFIVDIRLRKGIHYGITNKRVIILKKWLWSSRKSINLIGLNEVSYSEKQDGSGTITFGGGSFWSGQSLNAAGLYQRGPNRFEMIPKARQVNEIIMNAQAEFMKR